MMRMVPMRMVMMVVPMRMVMMVVPMRMVMMVMLIWYGLTLYRTIRTENRAGS